MSSFVKKLGDDVIKDLINHRLFNDKILPDIQNGVVFPAIRNNYIDFYYKGARLFQFNKSFKTHKKYLPIFSNKDYIGEDELLNRKFTIDLYNSYDEIKSICENYPGEEDRGVSCIYHNKGFVSSDEEVVVLDIEISFVNDDPNSTKKKDRIDLLLLNKKNNTLKFIEAKHFMNKEIWSGQGKKPEVTKQVDRYNKQIARQKNNILKQYSDYVEIANNIFGTNLTKPIDCCEKCGLLVFGFDNDQKQGRLKKLLIDDNSLDGVSYYMIGDINKIKLDTLWTKTNK